MKIRIYYEDTDCGNVVYYANYLKYMERSRTELLREMGIDVSHYHRKGIVFVVAEAHVKYKAPAKYDDLIEIITTIKELTPVTIVFDSTICKDDGMLLVEAKIRVACITTQGKPCRIPREIINGVGPRLTF